MDSEESATRLRQEQVQNTFKKHFRGSAKIKKPVYQVVVDFLPVTLRDTLGDLTDKMEENNSLSLGTIAKAKWIRAPKNWKEGQRFAHAILTVTGRKQASTLIQKGIIVEGQRMRVRKMEEEPRRCFKCQEYSNLCDKAVDGFRCINCKKRGLAANHATWDHACPRYIEERAKVKARDPGNQYVYFPTEEE
ncbi:hypothetical protein BYT27DRAFT_7259469 [Phlegmacium glaucopus]|nr:hypothetical protein BYT27DRAFT_7259469 [Phlegmacium glaucopus]